MTLKQFISSLSLSLILMGCLSKKTSYEVNQRLHDIWIAKRINGNSITESNYRPTLEINLTEGKIYGSDGCNNYQGNITNTTESTITFGSLASTRKMCQYLVMIIFCRFKMWVVCQKPLMHGFSVHIQSSIQIVIWFSIKGLGTYNFDLPPHSQPTIRRIRLS